jgi:hypothetical protein
VIPLDPNGIQRASQHASQSKHDADGAGGLLGGGGGGVVTPLRNGIEIGHDADANTHGDEGQDGAGGRTAVVEEVVQGSDAGRQEHASDLVELDAGVGERDVGQDDVGDHGEGEGEEAERGEGAGREEGERRAGERVQEEGGDGEVEGCEGDLGVPEGGVGEDALVDEDLGVGGWVSWVVVGRGGSEVVLTIAAVLVVLTKALIQNLRPGTCGRILSGGGGGNRSSSSCFKNDRASEWSCD